MLPVPCADRKVGGGAGGHHEERSFERGEPDRLVRVTSADTTRAALPYRGRGPWFLLGLAAALGEESIFRGAVQPKLGLLLTALLFALLHSQYGLSFSTVAVFGVGLILGVLRLRANTSTTMITHAVYNISLGLISYLGWLQNF